MHDATYSPDDNKLRMTPAFRLDKDDYNRFKKAGFRWAPKQGVFFAVWSPGRNDLLVEYCGEIGDDDLSLIDRAEDRAERFEGYSEKRAADAESAHAGVKAISDHIPLGQPILVGHHSEKRARKDAERIENGMRKAVKMWETSQYWTDRAAGAIRHAKYLERPQVRARRIKKIETDKRRQEKYINSASIRLELWKDNPNLEQAIAICNTSEYGFSMCFPLDKYPRSADKSQYEGSMSFWSALSEGIIDEVQARELTIPSIERGLKHAQRWIDHYNFRLEYEKAMLEEQGASDLLKPKPRPKQLPLLNYRAPEGIDYENIYHRNTLIHLDQVEITKKEYSGHVVTVRGTHRVKTMTVMYLPERLREHLKDLHGTNYHNAAHRRVAVFLTDSKEHPRPEDPKPEKTQEEIDEACRLLDEETHKKALERIEKRVEPMTEPPPLNVKSEPSELDKMRAQLKEGVKVVSAPQLFPTPPEIAKQMVELADIQPGQLVLEPSAGTGAIIKEIIDQVDTEIIGVELNLDLCNYLRENFPSYRLQVTQGDFLEIEPAREGNCGLILKDLPSPYYDRIVMNPPFKNGDDIKHIKHAMKFLNANGQLVALCANGPKQQRELEPLADLWEPLPPGSFKAQGTNVNVALLTISGQPSTTQAVKTEATQTALF